MSKDEERELCKYVRVIASEMGLRDWVFDVYFSNKHPEGGLPHDDSLLSEASCTPTIGRHHAVITFRHDFRKALRPEQQREIVVHELIHCHLTDMREFVRTGLHPHVSQSVYEAISFGHDLAWEHAVDAMAASWAERLPLIRWPE